MASIVGGRDLGERCCQRRNASTKPEVPFRPWNLTALTELSDGAEAALGLPRGGFAQGRPL